MERCCDCYMNHLMLACLMSYPKFRAGRTVIHTQPELLSSLDTCHHMRPPPPQGHIQPHFATSLHGGGLSRVEPSSEFESSPGLDSSLANAPQCTLRRSSRGQPRLLARLDSRRSGVAPPPRHQEVAVETAVQDLVDTEPSDSTQRRVHSTSGGGSAAGARAVGGTARAHVRTGVQACRAAQ